MENSVTQILELVMHATQHAKNVPVLMITNVLNVVMEDSSIITSAYKNAQQENTEILQLQNVNSVMQAVEPVMDQLNKIVFHVKQEHSLLKESVLLNALKDNSEIKLITNANYVMLHVKTVKDQLQMIVYHANSINSY